MVINMEKYRDRYHAGKIVASHMENYLNKKNTLVLALPRGGVPVAYEIASQLHLPLDLFIVRKLGVPGHPELALGALAMGGVIVFNQDILNRLNITKDEISAIQHKEAIELERRMKAYRGNRPYPEIQGKTIILVDDGIATGASMRVALKGLRQMQPASIVIAVPVADQAVIDEFEPLVDAFICPLRPQSLQSVGLWYEDFSQTEDQEVQNLLGCV